MLGKLHKSIRKGAKAAAAEAALIAVKTIADCSKNGGGRRPPTPLGHSGAEEACRS